MRLSSMYDINVGWLDCTIGIKPFGEMLISSPKHHLGNSIKVPPR